MERVVILGPPSGVKTATLKSKSNETCLLTLKLLIVCIISGLGSVNLKVSYDGEGKSLVIRKPGVNIAESFTINLH